MLIRKSITRTSLLLFTIMTLFSCSGQRPTNIGISNAKLSPCPDSPNCVSSDADDKKHRVLPFQVDTSAASAWQMAKRAVLQLPRTKIISETPEYLHAECTSSVFRFVDDLELNLRPADGIIAVRSASRLGHSDFGVNRDRVDTLRSFLSKQGLTQK